MWRLQQNVQYTKRRFFRDIVLFVIFCHVVLFALFIFVYNQTKPQHHFVVKPQSAYSTVVLMPLKKRVPQIAKSKKKSAKPSQLKKVISYKDYQKKVKAKKQSLKKKVHKKVAKPLVKKKQVLKKTVAKAVSAHKKKKPIVKKTVKPVAKVVQKKTSVVKKSPTVLKQEKVVTPKKIAAKPVEKKVVEKKVEPKVAVEKQVAKQQKEIKPTPAKVQEVIKPVAPEVKDVPEKVVQPVEKQSVPKPQAVEPVIEQAVEEVELKSEAVDTPTKSEEVIDLEDVTFVGRHDLEILQTEEVIQQEIMKYWKPPVGISKDKICLMLVRVDKKGHARSIKVKKTSGSMANDMCARAALLKVEYPQAVWGQEITVTLGQ